MKNNRFEENIHQQLGETGFRKVSSVKVGIAGAGGLGSNCACNLVRSGFKNLKIVDFDKIDHSNLNRQFYFLDQVGMDKVKALEENLRRINPDVNLEARVRKIERSNVRELFSDCDIVVEAFDRADYKSMIVEELLPLGKFIVSASGLAGYGSSDEIKVNRVKDNLVIVGDMKSDIETDPPISPRVNVAAAKQADVVLEHVLSSLL
ncbi:MAG: sulfur carrier protein ThiS adenylyltransferase ThiF [Candidatus Omnitrophota bacterium]